MHHFDISQIIGSLKSTYGTRFLETIANQLHQAIAADHTFIARVDRANMLSRTLAYVTRFGLQENFEYSLKHTPCADVSDTSTCIYAQNICEHYPEDELLQQMNIEGYIGAPLISSKGHFLGIVVAMYTDKIEQTDTVRDLFELFSGRIAAEIERLESEQALRTLNEKLESEVASRTSELKATVEQLQHSQQKLVQQEKLASLGKVVAGVAHEVNTPIGVAVLASSTIKANAESLQQLCQAPKVSKSAIKTDIDSILQAQSSIDFSLQKAAELVGSFKKLAAHSYSDERKSLALSSWLEALVKDLSGLLRETGISLKLHLPEKELVVDTFPARLAQVITNIVANSVLHAFPPTEHFDGKSIVVELSSQSDGIQISVKDNGIGMNEEVQANLFEPFYTTKRHAGGIGLGMSIVSNLVSESLEGSIDVHSRHFGGTEVVLKFQ